MPPDTAPIPKGRAWLRLMIAFMVAFDMAAFFQWADGAFQSEFGGHPDEAAHYLKSLNTRDREAASSPTTHAGAGSRVFDLALGGWMHAFGKSRIAAMLFMTVIAAATATLVFGAMRRESGDWAAAIASLLWLGTPAVREAYETILPEQLGAFILTGAALLWTRPMDAGNPRRTATAKWIGTAAMLGIGCLLAYVSMIAIKITPGDPRAACSFLKECVSVPGIAVAVFAVTGIMLGARGGAVWAAMAALVAGVLFARWMKAGVADVRVLIVATPALAMLAARGAVALAGITGSHAATAGGKSRRSALWILLLLLLALPPDLLSPWQKDWSGFGPAADALVEESHGTAHVLVVSDPLGEGLLLSEIAMRDGARHVTVERGSETLADPDPAVPRGSGQRFHEDEQLFAHLTSGRIRYIVLDSAVPGERRTAYHDQVRRVLDGNVRSFWPICDSPVVRDGEPQGHPLRIFRVMQSPDAELQ
ncbi:MAG: glycosyltransferase family 39 protein [Chthoniobacteraceae bacterium]